MPFHSHPQPPISSVSSCCKLSSPLWCPFGCYPRSELSQQKSKRIKNWSLTPNTLHHFLEEKVWFMFTFLKPPVPLLPRCQQARRDIVKYFSSPVEHKWKVGKVTKNFESGSSLKLNCWDLAIIGEEAKLQGFIWCFSKLRYPCPKRSAIWGYLACLAIHGVCPAASAP